LPNSRSHSHSLILEACANETWEADSTPGVAGLASQGLYQYAKLLTSAIAK